MRKCFLTCCLFIIILTPYVYGQVTTISGNIEQSKQDSIKIVLQINNITRQHTVHKMALTNGHFTDTLPITRATYFYMQEGTNYIYGLIEPGDKIHIRYHADSVNTSLQFSGAGAEKASLVTAIMNVKRNNKLTAQVAMAKTKNYPFDYLFGFIDSLDHILVSQLNTIKSSLTPQAYNLLHADITATTLAYKHRSVGMVYHESIDTTLVKRQHALTDNAKNYLTHMMAFNDTLAYSSNYINTVYNILNAKYDGLVMAKAAGKKLSDKYAYLSALLPAALKVPVLTLFLETDILNQPESTEIETLISSTYPNPNDSAYQSFIAKKYADATSFKQGMKAPDFIVENESGEKLSLQSFKGKVIYLDFWYGACGPCHVLFSAIKPVKNHFAQNKDVVFLTVSVDNKTVWQSALKKYKIPGYHVYTQNKESAHPIIQAYKVNGYPSTFLIDKNGKIFTANPSASAAELTKQMEAALAIMTNE